MIKKKVGKRNSVKDRAHKGIEYIIQVAFQINEENTIYPIYIINNNTNLDLLDENMEGTLKLRNSLSVSQDPKAK